MTLSVCLLTRDEEKHIERAIRSVRGVADEVIVADTGSGDRTVELAAKLGAKVTPCTWTDDFAAGRNFTVAQASGDWVLWLNGNEELPAASHDPLRCCMGEPAAFGFFVRLHNLTDPSRPRVYAETADLRLFRRRPDLKYVGRLHPHLHPDLVEAVKREGLSVPPCDVVLRHYADPSPPRESKLRWTARLLELELQDRPGQLHYLIEYGRTLLMLNDSRGHRIMATAADHILPLRDEPAAPSVKVQVLLNYLLTTPPEQSQAGISPEQARELALRWFPDSPGLLWVMAEGAFKHNDYARAAGHLRKLVALGRDGSYDRSQRFDPSIVGEDALMNLGVCFLLMKKFEEAEVCFIGLTNSPTLRDGAMKHLETIRRHRQLVRQPQQPTKS